MKQSKRSSLIESIANTVIGFLIATYAQVVIYPAFFGIHVSLATNAEIAAIFLLIGLVRGYVLRRAFEWARVKGVLP